MMAVSIGNIHFNIGFTMGEGFVGILYVSRVPLLFERRFMNLNKKLCTDLNRYNILGLYE
jgi:hypothetical protein